MHSLTLVTGNRHKLAEWRRLLPAGFVLENTAVDLDEIQSLDLMEIITDKARRAYAAAGKPVIVEDIAAGLDELGGLPGPFIKFFEKRLGMDALFQLAGKEGAPVTVQCAMAYYDGKEFITSYAEVHGTAVAARGQNGFGFDCCFVPAGQTETYAEMPAAKKDSLSHRAKAIDLLLPKLRAI